MLNSFHRLPKTRSCEVSAAVPVSDEEKGLKKLAVALPKITQPVNFELGFRPKQPGRWAHTWNLQVNLMSKMTHEVQCSSIFSTRSILAPEHIFVVALIFCWLL